MKQILQGKEYGLRTRRIGALLVSLAVLLSALPLGAAAAPAEGEPLLCGKEEHIHTEDCYTYTSELTCTAAPYHKHTEECYTIDRYLICGMDEGEYHTHTDICYAAARMLTCTLPESDHIHTIDCYTACRELTCGKAEHTHTAVCYDGRPEQPAESGAEPTPVPADPVSGEPVPGEEAEPDLTADLETEAGWKTTFENVVLTGNPKLDTVDIARTQIGYKESYLNYIYDNEGTKIHYTRYGEWYGVSHMKWCAAFIGFCMDYAGIDVSAFPFDASCVNWVKALKDEGRFAEPGYVPERGDILFTNTDGHHYADHAALIEDVYTLEDGTVTGYQVIEGNIRGEVQKNEYALGKLNVIGYGILPDGSEPEPSDLETTIEARASDGTTVIVTGILPGGAYVTIEPVRLSLAELFGYLDLNDELAVMFNDFYVYDVKIFDGEGDEWQPGEGTVAVTMLVPEAEVSGASVDVLHIHDNVPARIETEVRGEEIAFEMENFSYVALLVNQPEEPVFAALAAAPAPQYLPGVDTSNEWQITAEEFEGNTHGDKTEIDGDSDGMTEVAIQKNVVPTGTENEFLVYMGIDVKALWQNYLNSDFMLTTQNSWNKKPLGTYATRSDIGGNPSELVVERDAEHPDPIHVNIKIYDRENGILLDSFSGIRYSGIHCRNATVFAPTFDKTGFVSIAKGVGLQEGDEALDLNVFLDQMTGGAVIDMLPFELIFDEVTDTMGDMVEFVEVTEIDGTYTYDEAARTLTWLPEAQDVEVTWGTDPKVLTGWKYNVSQLVYRVRLNTQAEGFLPCADTIDSKAASIAAGESFAVNRYAVLEYHADIEQGSMEDMSAEFPVPEVRGLRYDIDFVKQGFDGETCTGLDGAEFSLFMADGTTPVRGADGKPLVLITAADRTERFADLPAGSYVLKETAVPEPYTATSPEGYAILLSYTDAPSALGKDAAPYAHNMRYRAMDATAGKWFIINETNAFSYMVRVVKTDRTDGSLKLSGAAFAVTDPLDAAARLTGSTGADGAYLFTDAALLPALFEADTEYALTETKAPAGYIGLSSDILFRVDREAGVSTPVLVNEADLNGAAAISLEETDDGNILTVTVGNVPGNALPHTGGRGREVPEGMGVLLLLACAAVVAGRRRGDGAVR